MVYTGDSKPPAARLESSSLSPGTFMKYFAFLALSFVLAAPSAHAAIASTQPVAIQPTSAVADATVNLYCTLRSGNKTYGASGSGVFIGDRGVILTNAHVAQYFLLARDAKRIKGQCFVRTGATAENAYVADVLYFPTAWIDANAAGLKKQQPKGTGENDFALLYVTGASRKNETLPVRFPALPLSFLVAEGEAVTVAGYPTANRSFDDIKRDLPRLITQSTVASTRSFTPSGVLTDLFTIASTSAASAGVSGGPVVRNDGALAGIVATKSDSQLRAITVAYMSAQFQKETGTSLFSLATADFPALAAANRALISGKQIIALREGLLRKR